MPTDVSAPFPQIDLPPGATITVVLDDPAAVITSLIVHGWQEPPRSTPAAPVPRLALEGAIGGPDGT